MNEIIELFASREQAERMLRDCLAEEPEWESILKVVPVELELSSN